MVADAPTAAARAGLSPVGFVAGAVAAASVGLAILGYRVLVLDHEQAPAEAAAQVAVAWTFVASGLVAWWRRPGSRVGPLLAAAGVGLLLRRLQYSDDSSLFTIGFALGEISNAFIAHAVLGYPTGRLRPRLDRIGVAAGYALVLALPLATLLVYDPNECFFECGPGAPAESLIGVFPNADAAELLRRTYRIAVFGVLGLLFVALIVRKLLASGSAGRRILGPLLVASVLAGVRAVSEAALTFLDYSESTRQALFWWQVAVQTGIPLALLYGLLRARLARAAVADALPALGRARSTELRDLLASVLGDRTLQVAFWVPDRGEYVDGEGRPFALPTGDPARAVTPIEHGGESVAVLVHDPLLSDEPWLVRDVVAAADLALENARLQAELQAQLAAVRESRARVVAAADAERQRIERDLHDGAQQRLLAAALALRTAERRHAGTLAPDVEAVLATTVSELQEAVADLRDLVYRLHPTILAEQGLAAALAHLAGRASVPVRLGVELDQRLPGPLEAIVYFVVCEALANVEKHAHASSAFVGVVQREATLLVDVEDDGIGGADPAGSGLRGLADRVEASGGSLGVATSGAGTRVHVELPCAS